MTGKRGWNMVTVLTILGVVLAAVGLIALRPQLKVEPSVATDRSQPFSVPFKISNDGLLSVQNVKISFYVHRLEVGPITVNRSISENNEWETGELGRGESKTVIFHFARAPMLPKKADVAIVVDHTAWGVPFKTLRSVFRFVGVYGDTWQWLPQPSSEIRGDVDNLIKYWQDRRPHSKN